MTAVQLVVPEGIDDPIRPSGGNRYDQRVVDALRGRGWTVVVRHDAADLDPAVPVVVDGLLGVRSPASYAGAVVLLHMPFAEAHPELAPAERALLTGARAVVTTSAWARDWVVAHHGLDPDRVAVARPGVDLPGSRDGRDHTALLCVGPVTRLKGHDVLVAALEQVADLSWTCTCAGVLDLDPDLVAALRASPVADRVTLTGPVPSPPYDRTGLLVSASRHESYGMAVTEALAHGVPVLVTDVGGHPEAVDGGGVLVPVDDADTLAKELRRWLTDPVARDELRRAAARRRTTLRSWDDTARDLEAVLR